MADLSTYAKNLIVNGVFRGTAPTLPSAVYVALFTSATGDGGTGTEVSGGSYARQAVTFGAPTDGVSANSADVDFPTASANWGTITHAALMDASTSGNMLAHAALATSKTINTGDTLTISAADLDLVID